MLRTKPKPCKYCGHWTHLSFQCPLNQKPLATYTTRKTRKPMKKRGRIRDQWDATRKKWFKLHPPNSIGKYKCYLCGRPLLPEETTLDHIRSRTRAPELRFVLSNLAPCCWDCNNTKGSRDVHELKDF